MIQGRQSTQRQDRFIPMLLVAIVTAGAMMSCAKGQEPAATAPISASAPGGSSAATGAPPPGIAETPAPATAQTPAPEKSVKPPPEVSTLETAKAVMVTVELDMPRGSSIADTLKQVERKYQAAGGTGRTFAVLDAYGEITPDGKVHMSMHVSTERPGMGSLIFRPTGEILWQSKIIPGSTTPPETKNLTIILDDGKGHGVMLDGSNNPNSILDTMVRDLKIPVRNYWPDGAEREVTFIYSACGCPVKVMVRRVGDKTVRTKELPVIFPDDPAAVTVITRLMRW